VIDRDFTNLNLIEAWVQYALPGYNLCHGTSAAEAKRMNEILFPYFIYVHFSPSEAKRVRSVSEILRKRNQKYTQLDKKKFDGAGSLLKKSSQPEPRPPHCNIFL